MLDPISIAGQGLAMMERRQFIQACAAMLGSSVLAAGCGSSGDSGSDTLSSGDDFSRPDLARARWDGVSTTFSVAHDDFGVIDMTLVEIDDSAYTLETEQFSIILSGPDAPLFDEGRYAVYNESLGDIELYLQPGDSTVGEQKYRAVFSLLA